MFYVGQNVVCVDADKQLRTDPDGGLVKGGIYTVSGLPNATGLTVYEVPVPAPFEAFSSRRFRPLKDISEDIMNQLRAPLNERSKEVA